jgi:hypothetical protein
MCSRRPFWCCRSPSPLHGLDPIVPRTSNFAITSGHIFFDLTDCCEFDLGPGFVSLFGNGFSLETPCCNGFSPANRGVLGFVTGLGGGDTLRVGDSVLNLGFEGESTATFFGEIVSSGRPNLTGFSGLLFGQTTDGRPFRYGLTGQGTLDICYNDCDGPPFYAFDFRSTAPVPEPATILFVVTGATAVLSGARLRRPGDAKR